MLGGSHLDPYFSNPFSQWEWIDINIWWQSIWELDWQFSIQWELGYWELIILFNCFNRISQFYERTKIHFSEHQSKLPISEHILIIKHFSIFCSSSTNWAIFVSLDAQTWGLQMFLKCQKWKTKAENTRKGWMIVCFKKFVKITLDLSVIAAPYLLPFWVI